MHFSPVSEKCYFNQLGLNRKKRESYCANKNNQVFYRFGSDAVFDDGYCKNCQQFWGCSSFTRNRSPLWHFVPQPFFGLWIHGTRRGIDLFLQQANLVSGRIGGMADNKLSGISPRLNMDRLSQAMQLLGQFNGCVAYSAANR